MEASDGPRATNFRAAADYAARMCGSLAVVVLPFALGMLAAQEAPTPTSSQAPAPAPKRSLADGLVRQRVETDALRLPRCDGGLEMAAGAGPLLLLVRRADGRLEFEKLERGLGEHGAAPAKVELDVPVEQEEGAAAPAKRAGAPQTATLDIRWADDRVELRSPSSPRRVQAAAIERDAVRPLLEELFAATKRETAAGNLLIEARPEVPVQDVLTILEVARDIGFSGVLFGGSGARRTLSVEQQEQLMAIPEEFGWKVERVAWHPRGICDGEVLLLVDGPARWGDIAPIYMVFARAGIWRISFACQQDAKTRWKLPANLPFDRGR